MASHLILVGLFAAWLAFLIVERVRLGRDRSAIPLCVAVTGTRGKTSVVRQLAAVLARDGRKVLAKTTGSEAAYLLPDGTVQEIHRLGSPSMIEQKRLLRLGAKMGVDVVLAEVMSLHRENHRVETQQILGPDYVLVTNFRVDHTEAQGETSAEVASVLSLDVPPGAVALVPDSCWEEGFAAQVAENGGRVVRVPGGRGGSRAALGEFGTNLDLVWAAARALGVEDPMVREGLRDAQGDVGSLRLWRYTPAGSTESWFLANAFAANDPESTLIICERVVEECGVGPESCIGLLSLRADRGERSLQWAKTLESGALPRFGDLFITGFHASAVKHRLRRHPHGGKVRTLPSGPPEEIMAHLFRNAGPEGTGGGEAGKGSKLLFGFGNINGFGRTMAEHWNKVGESYGI